MGKRILFAWAWIGLLFGSAASADDTQLTRGLAALEKMAGCYLVDYNYVETESLRPGYARDPRLYDVNANKSVKEWIYLEKISPNRVRLQHILFATDLAGDLLEGSELRHQAEDWEYAADFRYEFASPSFWEVKRLGGAAVWTRRITNLDDGLRYQCDAAWKLDSAFPEWSCDNYAPIPGRESRDMGRRDYNTLERSTRILVYGDSWLERQRNVKVVHSAENERSPLARELGKNWYVRIPDAECALARAFAEPRREFWRVLREAWDEVLVGDRAFRESSPQGQPSRYFRMLEIEGRYFTRNLADPTVRSAAKREIQGVIEAYRGD